MEKIPFKNLPLDEKKKLLLDVITVEILAKAIQVKFLQRMKGTKFADMAMKNAAANIEKYANTFVRTVAVFIGFDTPEFAEEVNYERVPLITEIMDVLVCLPPDALHQLKEQLHNVEIELPLNP